MTLTHIHTGLNYVTTTGKNMATQPGEIDLLNQNSRLIRGNIYRSNEQS